MYNLSTDYIDYSLVSIVRESNELLIRVASQVSMVSKYISPVMASHVLRGYSQSR